MIKENNEYAIEYIDRLLDNIVNKEATYDLIAVLCTLKAILERRGKDGNFR